MTKWAVYCGYGLMALLLMGCGFHLRGHEALLGQNISHLTVLPDTAYDPFIKAFTRRLQVNGVSVNKNVPKSAKLILEPVQYSTKPLAYGPSGELHRERLQGTLTYRFTPITAVTANADITQMDQTTEIKRTIKVERDRQLNLRQDLGDAAEKQMIIKEIERELIDQLIRQLNALSDSNSEPKPDAN